MSVPVTCKDFFCTESHPQPVGIIIFGASGDLTSRKLLPSLFNLFLRGLMPDDFYILGVARTEFTDETFREKVKESLTGDNGKIQDFLERTFYTQGEYDSISLYSDLKWRIKDLEKRFTTKGNKIFYMAVPPSLYLPIVENLGDLGLTSQENAFSRVIIEKPFGFDLDSANELDKKLHMTLKEDQIYRIDHYLGKETVQNILIFRFANSIFEPVWNNRYIDNVQITVAEDIGVEHRAGYYEHAGLVRDMFQNHMMQLLSLVTIEPPSTFDADEIHNEKVKIFRSIRPFPLDDLDSWFVRGQYGRGKIDGKEVVSYVEEPGVNPNSKVETFAAAKFMIDNWRWSGVPFYMRSGKRLQKRVSEIIITFKRVPHSIFPQLPVKNIPSNILKINIQPEEGIVLSFQAKHPGPKLCMSTLTMDFKYTEVFGTRPPEAYERLLLDCMFGDQTLFIRDDVMRESWKIFTPLIKKWESEKDISKLDIYEAGTWGSASSDELIKKDGREWYNAL
ncbi:MAG TPA: glucose-6-phosphate dehydrogenase [Mesoaciditoga lauensis]|nr:glucose-6-phosphate dehydrogenase [Mesoaciditoga lauensis]